MATMYDADGQMIKDEGESPYEDHAEVLSLLETSQDADSDMREQAREAHLFVDKRDGQWEPYWWNQNAGKPRYTFDMTSPVIDQICGEIEQSDFDIRVQPAGGDATKDLALMYDGIIRNIENISRAKEVYNEAARGMVTCGFDAWRISQKYVNDGTFDQDLVVEKIHNAIDRVWFDPTAEKRDRSDANWVVLLHAVGKKEYLSRWPDGACSSVGEGRLGEAYTDKAEVVIVGEILYRQVEERDLVLMSNGATYEDDDDFAMIADELAMMGVTEVKRRSATKSEWYSRFFDNDGWLEDAQETVFSRCPIIPVYANFKVFENKTTYHGVVEKLLDPQRVMNYSLSREIEEGALAPRAKYWMTTKQASGHEDTLATLNTNSDPVQFFNPDPENPGAPQQNGGAQINPGLRTISESMRQIIGQTAGMFAANMGDNPGLQSGVAIQQLQSKGDNGTIKYFKAMEVAIAATGQVLVDAIPKLYTGERQVRLMYEDGTFEMSPVNQTVIDQQTGQLVVINDLSQGTYDVVCSSGPSFVNRQTETIEFMLELAKIDPSVMQIGGDVFLNNMNTPAARELAERRRAMMLKQGLIPPKQMTDEERQEMAQAQQAQGQQQDPAMVLAQAEMLKAQAELANAQTEQLKAQAALITAQARAQGVNIDMFEAETSRMDTQIKAQEAGVKIQKQSVETEGVMLDNAKKVREIASPIGFNG